MTNLLHIKDPVFAAYLLSKGHFPIDFDPSVKNERAKTYVYGEDVRNMYFEALFLGAGVKRHQVSWRDFSSWINRLLDYEESVTLQHANRTVDNRITIYKDQTCFQTCSPEIAAFAHNASDDANSICVDVQGLGKNRGYRHIFTEGAKMNLLYQQMLNGVYPETTWAHAKDMYKLGTMVRRAFEHQRTKDPHKEPEL